MTQTAPQGAGAMVIGTAGWSIPRAAAHHFPGAGTHLERYARAFDGAEINSSFHRPHRRAAYVKWAAATPPHFQFAVKLPRLITHDQALRRPRQPLERFLEEIGGLGSKRGPILVQLPPSHAFSSRVVGRFFEGFRRVDTGPIVCEPRHATWFTTEADRLLDRHQIARVAADPARAPGADAPGGWKGLAYFRLHGSPRMYWSRYGPGYLERLASAIRTAQTTAAAAWCVFDNTASGAAIENAWELSEAMAGRRLLSSEATLTAG